MLIKKVDKETSACTRVLKLPFCYFIACILAFIFYLKSLDLALILLISIWSFCTLMMKYVSSCRNDKILTCWQFRGHRWQRRTDRRQRPLVHMRWQRPRRGCSGGRGSIGFCPKNIMKNILLSPFRKKVQRLFFF